MDIRWLTSFFVILTISCGITVAKKSPPHILFIVADDLGWNDVSWNNAKMKMPTLDKLATKGVILNSSYVQPTCSPSRGAMMTGYYPFHMGMQRGVISKFQSRYLPIDKETLPEALKKLGYATHMVGKWHLGFCNWKHTPTKRGFDSFYGFYSGAEDYYKHTLAGGYDFRFNTSVHHPPKYRYSTTLFGRRGAEIVKNHNPEEQPLFLYMAFQGVHSPLQVPKMFSNQYPDVMNKNRKIYNGMVTAMDSAVDMVISELRRKGYMENLVVAFTSDNGGASYIAGSNWPLRGTKNTLWDGGTRVPSFVYSKTLFKKTGYVHNGLFHASDWFPTFIKLAGGTTSPFIDGVDQWRSIGMGWPSPRTELVYNINEVKRTGAIRVGDYKLIVGSPGRYNSWYPEKTKPSCKSMRKEGYKYQQEERLLRKAEMEDRKALTKEKGGGWWFSSPMAFIKHLAGNVAETPVVAKVLRRMNILYDQNNCDRFDENRDYEIKHLKPASIHLFNVIDDPTEKNNLATKKPVLVKKMMQKFKEYKKTLVKSLDNPPTKQAHPKYHNGVWSPGWC